MHSLRKAVTVAVLFAVSGLATAATAATVTPPAGCVSGRENIMFNAGVTKGRSLVDQAWKATNVGKSCQNIDKLQSAIVNAFNSIQVPPQASQAVVCQFLGQHQGALDRLADLQATCPADQCILDGQFVGRLGALLFCDLSIALNGIGMDVDLGSGAVDTCGAKFEEACREVFASTAQNFSQENPGENCVPYTQPPFLDAYNQNQHNQCLYDPLPPSGAYCGDGVVNQSSEECEPPNTASCDANCKKIPFCGDGLVNQPSEQCEPPNTASCDASCKKVPSCGDGVVNQPSEECEPPNTASCDASCKKLPFCGDGVVNQPSEQCEPPNTSGCDATCKVIQSGCSSCETAKCDAFFSGPGAWGCSDLSGSAKVACENMLNCIRSSHCAAATQDTQACYCGTAADLACLTGAANGACKAEVEAAAETTDPGEIASRFTDPAYAVGRVANEITCEVSECSSACPL